MVQLDLFDVVPSRSRPDTFADDGDVFLGKIPTFAEQMNLAIAEINANASLAESSATLSVGSSVTALAGANFKGAWSSLTGALNKPASVSHSGKFWALLNNLANVTTSQPGVSADWIEITTSIPYYTYDNRNTLRTLSGSVAMVEDLGLFYFVAGSTEIDDDQTCFATASGRWLIQQIGPLLLDSVISETRSEIGNIRDRLDAFNSKFFVFEVNFGPVSSMAPEGVIVYSVSPPTGMIISPDDVVIGTLKYRNGNLNTLAVECRTQGSQAILGDTSIAVYIRNTSTTASPTFYAILSIVVIRKT